mmetsp:Transcript_9412/g.23199  ORF Transcript_9412/g.23199 Transcript_9412/m.23199 type:complete len:315 (-) Transcript_9412:4440-5384(-)
MHGVQMSGEHLAAENRRHFERQLLLRRQRVDPGREHGVQAVRGLQERVQPGCPVLLGGDVRGVHPQRREVELALVLQKRDKLLDVERDAAGFRVDDLRQGEVDFAPPEKLHHDVLGRLDVKRLEQESPRAHRCEGLIVDARRVQRAVRDNDETPPRRAPHRRRCRLIPPVRTSSCRRRGFNIDTAKLPEKAPARGVQLVALLDDQRKGLDTMDGGSGESGRKGGDDGVARHSGVALQGDGKERTAVAGCAPVDARLTRQAGWTSDHTHSHAHSTRHRSPYERLGAHLIGGHSVRYACARRRQTIQRDVRATALL